MTDHSSSPVARRSFLSRLCVGAAAFGAAIASGAATAAQSPELASPARWQPRRHPQDDWLDRVPGHHRLVFDTTMPEGLGGAMLYASNFYLANQNGYSLGNADVAVVMVVRHNSTPFAYNEAMWAKYGAIMAQRSNVIDPATGQPPKINIYNSGSAAAANTLRSSGITLDGLISKGMHVAVCEMATRRIAGTIAQSTSAANAVYTELVANLIGNAHMVPAGILAVNRAQERGYSFANVGV
jgi:intracellular sulfur oxidation DsrE/DsrF family protein